MLVRKCAVYVLESTSVLKGMDDGKMRYFVRYLLPPFLLYLRAFIWKERDRVSKNLLYSTWALMWQPYIRTQTVIPKDASNKAINGCWRWLSYFRRYILRKKKIAPFILAQLKKTTHWVIFTCYLWRQQIYGIKIDQTYAISLLRSGYLGLPSISEHTCL